MPEPDTDAVHSLIERDEYEMNVTVLQALTLGEIRKYGIADLDRELAASIGDISNKEGNRVELAIPSDPPPHGLVVVAVEPVVADDVFGRRV